MAVILDHPRASEQSLFERQEIQCNLGKCRFVKPRILSRAESAVPLEERVPAGGNIFVVNFTLLDALPPLEPTSWLVG